MKCGRAAADFVHTKDNKHNNPHDFVFAIPLPVLQEAYDVLTNVCKMLYGEVFLDWPTSIRATVSRLNIAGCHPFKDDVEAKPKDDKDICAKCDEERYRGVHGSCEAKGQHEFVESEEPHVSLSALARQVPGAAGLSPQARRALDEEPAKMDERTPMQRAADIDAAGIAAQRRRHPQVHSKDRCTRCGITRDLGGTTCRDSDPHVWETPKPKEQSQSWRGPADQGVDPHKPNVPLREQEAKDKRSLHETDPRKERKQYKLTKADASDDAAVATLLAQGWKPFSVVVETSRNLRQRPVAYFRRRC